MTPDDYDRSIKDIEANQQIRRGIERERMLHQIDHIEHNVAVSARILCIAVSLAVALLVAHELETEYGDRLVAFAAFVVTYFGVNWLLRRGLK